jgi:histidyl-tRNA synthetase
LKFVKLFNIPEKNLFFSPTLARGLDYYTGLIFEVFIPDINIGAVCGGGRYDNLCKLFIPENLTGVGVAFGFDRIMIAMEELKLLEKIKLNTLVLLTNFSVYTLNDSVSLFNDLIEEGISAELYLENSSLKKTIEICE